MGAYLIQRITRGVATVFGISVAVFFLTHVLADPVATLLPLDATQETVERVRRQLGLDEPIPVQFKEFLLSALRGDFGASMQSGLSSRDLLLGTLPATAYLAAVAFVLAGAVGLTLGILASLRPRSKLDSLVSALSMAGVSMPEFWLALLLISVVAVQFHLLPTSGFSSWQHVILPALVLSIRPTGRIAQVTRSTMVDELRRQHVVTAHSKGLDPSTVVRRHVLKNAAIPIVTMAGLEVADLISGAIIVETVFSWPGVGQLAGRALASTDFPLIQTVVLWAALVTVAMNLLVDLSYAWLDPRIRYR